MEEEELGGRGCRKRINADLRWEWSIVYREVCSACHSLDRIAWRNLVGVSHTVDEVKAMAEEIEYTDGPNDEGEMFQRP